MVSAHEVKKVQEFLIKPAEAWFAELQQQKILPKGNNQQSGRRHG